MSDDPIRMNTYLNAITALSRMGKPEHWVTLSTREAIAAACIAVADQEQAELRAEIERLTVALAESEADWQRESDARDQDFADDSATIARVKALCDEAAYEAKQYARPVPLVSAFSIRDALDAPTEPGPDLERGSDAPTPACADHKPVQHRDGKPPWCNACHWTNPVPGKPAMHKDHLPGLATRPDAATLAQWEAMP